MYEAIIGGIAISSVIQLYLNKSNFKQQMKATTWNRTYHCNSCSATFSQASKAQLLIEGGIKSVENVYDDTCPICNNRCDKVHDFSNIEVLTWKEIKELERQMKIQNKLFYSNVVSELKSRVFEARLKEEKLQLEQQKDQLTFFDKFKSLNLNISNKIEEQNIVKESILESKKAISEIRKAISELLGELEEEEEKNNQESLLLNQIRVIECRAIGNYLIAISDDNIVYIAKHSISVDFNGFIPLSNITKFSISTSDLIDVLFEFGRELPQYRKVITEQLKINNLDSISFSSKTQFLKSLRFDNNWYISDNFNFQIGCSEKGEPSFRNMKTGTIYLISSLFRTPIGSEGRREVLKACAEYPDEKLREKILTATFASLKEACELSIVFGFTDQNNYILAFDENKRSVYISLKTGVVKLLSNIMGDKEVSSEDIREIVDFISKVPHNLHKKILQMDIKGVKISSLKKDYISDRTKYIWDIKEAAYNEYKRNENMWVSEK